MHILQVILSEKFAFFCSFHVGSGCYDARAYATAVSAARSVFDLGVSGVLLFIVVEVFKTCMCHNSL